MVPFSHILIESLKESVVFYYNYWWFFTPIMLWPIFQLAWVNYVQEKYFRSIKWNLLEIKIPREIEKRPKTMEEFFSGIYSTNDVMIDTLYDIYLDGTLDIWFSFEIVSIEGDVHFYVRTPTRSRDIIEAQIYAQYPDAEIKEVEDYVTDMPDDIPSKDYEMWGTSMTLGKEDAYPLRTYKEFEDTASGEFVDPISNIVEGVSKLKKGEQIWMQILVRATDDKWKKEANDLVLDLIGRKKKKKTSNNPFSIIIDEIIDIVRYIAFGFFTVVNPAEESEKDKTKEEESISLMLHLSPGEKDVVTAIDNSTKRTGFETDIRWMYLAKRDIFDKAKGAGIIFSYFAQFGSQDLNYLIPNKNTKTSAYYFLTEFRTAIRKRRILRKYKRREFDEKGYVLNTEELATLFHFPTIEVKAPVAPRVEAKKGKPPAGLPI
ncbi:MAG: hypothetical protein KAQ87_03770 [Candidatus Pacebacteria bacterium]|nr:hypothetical protein [Candidatus Paceibacterota bacterium]